MSISRSSAPWRRIIFNVSIGISFLYFPWWITALIGIVFVVSDQPFEIILWGVLIDALGGAPVPTFYNVEMLFTIGFLVLLIASRFVRTRLMIDYV